MLPLPPAPQQTIEIKLNQLPAEAKHLAFFVNINAGTDGDRRGAMAAAVVHCALPDGPPHFPLSPSFRRRIPG